MARKLVSVLVAVLFLATPASANPFGAIARHVKRHWLWYTLTAVSASAVALDVNSTEDVIHRCPGCSEGGIHLFGGRRPSAAQLSASDFLLYEGPMAVLNWYLIREGKTDNEGDAKYWNALAIGNTGVRAGLHLYGWNHNKHICPGGTNPTTGVCR